MDNEKVRLTLTKLEATILSDALLNHSLKLLSNAINPLATEVEKGDARVARNLILKFRKKLDV